jgi:hypothetical protein
MKEKKEIELTCNQVHHGARNAGFERKMIGQEASGLIGVLLAIYLANITHQRA